MALKHKGVLRLGYVRVAVREFEKSVDFLTDSLGLLRADEMDGQADRAFLRCWHEPQAFSYVLEAGDDGLTEIGLQVRDEQDLDEARSAVEDVGISVADDPSNEPLANLGRSVRFEVPSGPRVRLYASQSAPGPSVGNKAPHWNPPRSLRATPAPMFLTHLGITTPEPGAVVGFFQDVLGFGLSEVIRSDDGAEILSGLLFRSSSGQDIAVFPGDRSELHHIAFMKHDAVEILRDGTYLREDGAEIDLFGPTRQPYGRTFSLHFLDPNGIRYELCAGGRFAELHPSFKAVEWTESNVRRAFSSHASVENDAFYRPSFDAAAG